jgi:sensor domain CHASE-containing protein
MIYIAVFAALASIYLFTAYNRVQKTKRDERRDQINERRQELLDNVLKSKEKKSSDEND